MGVSNDDPKLNGSFARECGFSYPLICDIDLTVSVAYGAAPDKNAGKANRIAVLVDREGIVQKIWNNVDARTFPQECFDSLPPAPPPKPPYVKPGLQVNMEKLPPERKLKCEFCGFKYNTAALPVSNRGECPKCLAMPTKATDYAKPVYAVSSSG